MASSYTSKYRRSYATTAMNLQERPVDYARIDLRIFEKSPVWSDKYLSQINLQQRPYDFQIELVQSVIQSQKNTIICVRTGSGKTYVAALLIKYYYMKKMISSRQRFLSFFFIPHRAIRDQQALAIESVGDLRVSACDDDSFVSEYIRRSDVIVCTPQKFLNCLLQERSLRMTDIDLMIFDECHNCIGSHPYSQIMKQCLLHYQQHQLPRIIGMTASCSTKITNMQQLFHSLSDDDVRKGSAIANLYQLCATINCQAISAVTKRDQLLELEKKISRPTQDEIVCVDSKPFDQHTKKFKETLIYLMKEIRKKCSPKITSTDIEQQLVEQKQDAEKKGEFTNVILIKYLIMLVKRLDAITDLPLNSLIIDLINRVDSFYNKKETPIEVEIQVYELCQNKLNSLIEQLKESVFYFTNPKLDLLSKLIRKHTAEREDARGLILVQRTFYAKNVFDYLQNREDMKGTVKPCWLVGQSGTDFTKTINEQDETLKDFRKGLCNVMVATDVVQEGLDVPQCSYVVRYEFVSSEIGTVQARGRARTQNSAYYLITTSDSQNYMREKINRLKEKQMDEALEEWKQMSPDELKQNIAKKQVNKKKFIKEEIVNGWQHEEEQTNAASSMLTDTPPDGKVSCRSCGYYLGKLEWLRRRNTCYFVQKQHVLERVEIELKLEPKQIKDIQINGKVRCGNTQCREELGGAQEFLNRKDMKEICALKCNQLKFSYINKESGRENIIVGKKWTELPFRIVELETRPPRRS